MTKQRPIRIIILAILVGLGALIALYNAVLYLRFMGNSINPTQSTYFALLGAFNSILIAAIFAWMIYNLWTMRLETPVYIAILAVIAIAMVFTLAYALSSFTGFFLPIVLYAVIAMFCLTPGVKEALRPAPETPADATKAAGAAVVAAGTEAEAVPEPADGAAAATGAAAIPGAAAAGAALAAAAIADERRSDEVSPFIGEPEASPAETAEAASAEAETAEADLSAAELAAASSVLDESSGDETAAAETAGVAASAIEEPSEGVPEPVKTDLAHAVHHNVPVETIEGIGPAYGAKLRAAGVLHVADLLMYGASRKGREDLVKKTGISPELILRWVNIADLMRISGIGEEYSELLEAAGVDTVKELRNRHPEHLYQSMLQANLQHKMVRRTPHLSEVQSWVEQAKQLEPVMTY